MKYRAIGTSNGLNTKFNWQGFKHIMSNLVNPPEMYHENISC